MPRLLPPLAALSVLAVLSACSAEPAPEIATPRPVLLDTVERASPQTNYEFVGRVEARQTVDIAFQVGGQLAALTITEGQPVEIGEELAALDLEDFERVEREARVQLQQARTDLERQQTLHGRGIASQAALDSAQTNYDLRAVSLETASRNLGYATIEAPFDGLISRRLVDAYTVVSPGQPIARLQDVSELRVSIPVSEDLVATFTEEDVVSVTAAFPFLPGQTFPLESRELISEADSASRTYRAILALPQDLPANILPGMTATVNAQFRVPQAIRDHVAIPLNAVGYDAQGHAIAWVYDPQSGQVASRRIVTGTVQLDHVDIIEGLAPGEEVVIAGINALYEGMPVRPMSDPTAIAGGR